MDPSGSMKNKRAGRLCRNSQKSALVSDTAFENGYEYDIALVYYTTFENGYE